MLNKNELIKEFTYNSETGILYRNNKISGWEDHGYLRVSYKNKKIYVHRIVWVITYDENPLFIDHINGNKKDNRISNLRSVTNIENCKNCKLRTKSTSGHNGISFNKNIRKFEAYIWDKNKKIHLGLFENIKDAISTRKIAEKKYLFHENHGRV